ncbi:DUF302 domain-containing protein [Roseibium aggregatum]|uniref:DUF302 domain-containing protein n=1 Tax=Roseibium aggregatum TaxID=187304 RepID=A0A939J3M3_9HYPH|nr:DUF302 domain-containing protein [Roseibium aggregatum]MBN9670275.1 DUF302 domain-containing protein [Roseibium aggregatum]
MLGKICKAGSVLAAAAFICGGAASADGGASPEGVTVYEVSGAFEDIRFDLENAIVNRGLVIDYVSHIGNMLDRTGSDVGSEKQIFIDAQSMLFCSANLSRKAMEADPANIAYCPYTVFVYETPDKPGSVTVGYRELTKTGPEASKMAIAEVNALLDEIAREAAGQ